MIAITSSTALEDERSFDVGPDRARRRALSGASSLVPDARRVVAHASPPAVEPRVDSSGSFERTLDLLDLEPCGLEQLAPLVLRVVADVRRVAQLLGLLDLLAHVERVLDHEQSTVRDARHLADGGPDVVEMMRRDPRHDDVERAVRERKVLGAADHVGLHPRRGIARDDVQPPASRSRRATWPPPVATSSAVRRPAAHSTIRSRSSPLAVRRPTLAVRLRASSRRRHAASSTALLRGVEHRRLDVEVRRRGVGEDPPPLLGVRAVEADDDRQLDLHLVERLQDAARDLVAARDPAEDVEEDRLHLRVARDHLERVDDALRVAAAAEVAEVRGPAAGERRRRRPSTSKARRRCRGCRPSPSSFTYVTPFSRANASSGSAAPVAHLGDVRMPVERVVVDRELRVERLHLAVGRDDQRVDLAQHRVALDEGLVELLDDRGDLLLLARILDAGAVDEPARLPGLEALERVDVQAHERVGILLGDLLDLDAALRREHEERLLLAAVERDREVVLLRDVRGALDPELPTTWPADVEAEDVLRLLLGVGRIVGELDAARLAAAAGEHLRLDDDLPADLLGRLRASSGVVARRPSETGMPKRLKSCLP